MMNKINANVYCLAPHRPYMVSCWQPPWLSKHLLLSSLMPRLNLLKVTACSFSIVAIFYSPGLLLLCTFTTRMAGSS